MKKLIILSVLLLVINKAVAGTPLSADEYFLFYIPAALLIILWIAKIIRKNYLKYKAQISIRDIGRESETPVEKSEATEPNGIPEIFTEKDVFGLDKPSTSVDADDNIPQ